jgi:hypothetical protein
MQSRITFAMSLAARTEVQLMARALNSSTATTPVVGVDPHEVLRHVTPSLYSGVVQFSGAVQRCSQVHREWRRRTLPKSSLKPDRFNPPQE